MNRDRTFSILTNLLSGAFGVLIGFVVAYFAIEAIGPRQAPRIPPGQAAAQASAGQAAQNAGDPGDAERRAMVPQLESFLASNPGNADAWLQLAHVAYDLEDWPRAVDAYQRYLDLAPADPDVLSDLGVSLRGVGRGEEALAAFDRAQQIAPQHWQSRFNEVVVLAFDLGRFDAAAEVIDELRELQPDNPNVEQLAAAVERSRNAT